MIIEGRCHCGNIAFELDWRADPDEIPARACDCTFCVKHGGVWTSKPDGALKVRVERGSLVPGYAFGTRTAVFHVCRQCGVVPVVTSHIDGKLHAVVNVNTFENVDATTIRRGPASFDGEGTDDRLARRIRNWIGEVTLEIRGK